MKNNIEAIFNDIAIEKRDLKLPIKIAKRVDKDMGLKPMRLYRWRKNESQPDILQTKQLLTILQEYKPSLTLEDLVVEEDSVSQKVVNNFFS